VVQIGSSTRRLPIGTDRITTFFCATASTAEPHIIDTPSIAAAVSLVQLMGSLPVFGTAMLSDQDCTATPTACPW
jgi:hypothetical protein